MSLSHENICMSKCLDDGQCGSGIMSFVDSMVLDLEYDARNMQPD